MTQHTDPFRSKLKNARGLGSAKSGAHHWIAERVSAIALLLLTVWLVYFLSEVVKTGGGYDYVRALLQQPLHAIGAILFICTAIYHGTLGSQVVFEDYIHTEWMKHVAILKSRFFGVVLALASTFSNLSIYVNG